MASKHILFLSREIVPFYYGGIGTLFMSLAKYAKEQGHDVSYLTQRRGNFDLQKYEKYYEDIPVYFVDAADEDSFIDYSPSGGVINTFNIAYSFSVAESYEELINEIKPDIVFSADFGAEAFALLVTKTLGNFSGTRFVVHLSGALREIIKAYQAEELITGSFDDLSEPSNKLICSMEDICTLLADDIISPSEFTLEQVYSRYERALPKLRVIPNLMDDKFQQAALNWKITEHDPNPKVILFIGRLDHIKGADVLLNLYLDFLKIFKGQSKLIFLGRDCFCKAYGKTFLEEWEAIIPETFRERIEFTGQLDHSEVSAYLKQATVCVFPSRWEAFGNVCIEAMAHGVPAMVSNGTGLSGLIGDELKEYCFDFITDKDQIFKKLNKLLTAEDNNIDARIKFRQRSIEIIELGEQGYRKFFEEKFVETSKKLSSDTSRALLDSLKIMSDISGFLGNDLLKVKKYCELSDDDLKNIIQKGEEPVQKNFFGRLKSLINN